MECWADDNGKLSNGPTETLRVANFAANDAFLGPPTILSIRSAALNGLRFLQLRLC